MSEKEYGWSQAIALAIFYCKRPTSNQTDTQHTHSGYPSISTHPTIPVSERFLTPYQCCVTRVGTQTRVRTLVHFFDDSDLDSDSEIVTRAESRPYRVALFLLYWHSIHCCCCCCCSYSLLKLLDDKWGRENIVCFHVLEDKEILNMWTTGLVTRTWNLFWIGLSDSDSDSEVMDSDSDSEVMTRTQTRIWQFGLGHSTAPYSLFSFPPPDRN